MGMSMGITVNNLFVAFLTFVLGVFFSIGALVMIADLLALRQVDAEASLVVGNDVRELLDVRKDARSADNRGARDRVAVSYNFV